jgi:hypothetical protein
MAISFLDLAKATNFRVNPYPFNYDTPSGGTYTPVIRRSPDGTIFLVVTAANNGPNELTASFIDQVSGAVINLCSNNSIPTASSSISASITANNQISFSLGGTTYPNCSIP